MLAAIVAAHGLSSCSASAPPAFESVGEVSNSNDPSQQGSEALGQPGSGRPSAVPTLTQSPSGFTNLYQEPAEPGTLDPADACAGFVFAAEERPLDMFFLIDTSASMAERTAAGSKWELISSALVNFIREPRNAAVGVGLGYFPLEVDPVCVVGDPGCLCIPFIDLCLPNFGGSCNVVDYSAPAVPLHFPLDGPTLIGDINSRTLAGGTPTGPAMEGALEYAADWAAQHPGRRTVVVLATDGDPTGCFDNTPNAVATLARAAFDGPSNIRTFVIGVGRSLTSLNLVANAGGTTQAFLTETDSTLVQDFADALDKIRTEALPCEYVIPEEGTKGSVDPDQINVLVTPRDGSGQRTVPRTFDGSLAACGDADGWYYDDPSAPRSVRLCDRTCSDAFGANVELQFGCEPVIAVPR